MSLREPRADARANRERIVGAARSALAAAGADPDGVALSAIGRAAGVGQGTLYRHFPTREHLLVEVYRTEVGELADTATALLAAHPPWIALTRYLDRLLDYVRVKRGVMVALTATAWRDLSTDQHTRLAAAFSALLTAGRAAGVVRDDVEVADVEVLLTGLARIPQDQWDHRAPRVVALILEALRAR
ncbi:TetR/AcrR family transcriptional regulator [Pseudonocardia sp. ICBG1293]|uniref:TetR/AcrR family transcriptional regulator n=1 Tax=Pseudonocardia sp. ICBG1293 TaxID=2844382 RepID=UPI001CCB0CDA|nr:TetR/AcrR family transcriptional regulator [Pseudonocardia sp. ICBG1293]